MGARISPEKGRVGPVTGGAAPAPTVAGGAGDGPPRLAGLLAALRERRGAMPADFRRAADARIAAGLDDRLAAWAAGPLAAAASRPWVLAAFWPIADEPDLRAWLGKIARQPAWRMALPVIERRAAPLHFRAWAPGAPMRRGDYGIPEPAQGPWLRPDVVLVPTLGFTGQGDRIGYGGGFYDRTLEALRRDGPVWALGVAYACGRLAPGTHVPAPHDARLDAVVTEEGWAPG